MKRTLSGFSEVDLKEQGNAKRTTQSSVKQEDVVKEYDKIKNLSQEEAQKLLFNEVFRQKQNGTFNFEALSAQVEGLRGYLPEKDFQNLKRMLESLR